MKSTLHFAGICILISVAVLCEACQQTAAEPTPIPATDTAEPLAAPVETLELEPTPDEAQSLEIIVRALLALNTRPNQMEVTTIPEDGAVQASLIAFVPPDRKHVISMVDGVEYIIIEAAVYGFDPESGQWAVTEIPASSFMGETPVTEESLRQTISEAQFVRRDQLEGVDVLIYSFSSTAFSQGLELDSRTELWMTFQDGLPFIMQTDGEILSVSTDPGTGETKLAAVPAHTSILIDFDDSIVIEAPVP